MKRSAMRMLRPRSAGKEPKTVVESPGIAFAKTQHINPSIDGRIQEPPLLAETDNVRPFALSPRINQRPEFFQPGER
jgi:hypothetical protein